MIGLLERLWHATGLPGLLPVLDPRERLLTNLRQFMLDHGITIREGDMDWGGGCLYTLRCEGRASQFRLEGVLDVMLQRETIGGRYGPGNAAPIDINAAIIPPESVLWAMLDSGDPDARYVLGEHYAPARALIRR